MKRAIVTAVASNTATLLVLPGLAAAQPGANPQGSMVLSIYSANPAYFESPDGKPVVMIGDYEASPICPTGVPMDPNYDYRIFFDTLKENGLNFAKVWIFYGVEAAYDSETPFDEYHRFNLLPYLRTGPGHANDGRPNSSPTTSSGWRPPAPRRARAVSTCTLSSSMAGSSESRRFGNSTPTI